VDNKIVYGFVSAIKRSDNQKEVEKSIIQLFTGDYGELDNSELKTTVDNLLNSIFPSNPEISQQIKIALKYVDEDGNEWTSDSELDKIYERLGGVINKSEDGTKTYDLGESQISYDVLDDIKQEDIKAIKYAESNMSVDLSTIDSWEELAEVIQRAKDKMSEAPELEKDGTLLSILNDEDYSSKAETYEKNLSSLTSALETIRTEGKLTAEQMKELQETIPNITDFSKESLSDTALEELSSWIGEFKKDIDTMSPEGLK